MASLTEVYQEKSPSTLPKGALALVHLGAVLAVAWLLWGGGVERVSAATGLAAQVGPPQRRAVLFAATVVYFLRTLVTTFVFFKRRVRWSEAMLVAGWIGLLQLLYAFLGARRTAPLGAVELLGVLLYLAGSFLNTGSECQRHLWKRDPRHRGQLYTQGLFRCAMHVNYFGDLVLFTGWVLLAHCWPLLVIPVLMLLGFVFLNVPALDRYLAGRYGQEFTAYAARTAKLIPLVY